MQRHIPVLIDEVVKSIPQDIVVVMDGTIGHGGHSEVILDSFGGQESFEGIVGFDRDEKIIVKAKENLCHCKNKNKIFYVNDSYSNIDRIKDFGYDKLGFILLDLGVNLEHFKDFNRGFSIKTDGPLDMRFTCQLEKDATHLINKYGLYELMDLFVKYGDFNEKSAYLIANNILRYRKLNKIDTTFKLKEAIGLSDKKLSIVFQCIRIEVNNELGNLEEFLGKFGKYLIKGGVCGIITYHSIEDRIVKTSFKEMVNSGSFELVNKHVIKPSYKEINSNRASRSAKLRLIKSI